MNPFWEGSRLCGHPSFSSAGPHVQNTVHIDPWPTQDSSPLLSAWCPEDTPAPHWLSESKARTTVPECKRWKIASEHFEPCALAGHSPRGLKHVCLVSTVSLRHLQETLPGKVYLDHFQTCSGGLSLPRYYPIRHVATTSGTLMTTTQSSRS